jgi:hypothetical protein
LGNELEGHALVLSLYDHHRSLDIFGIPLRVDALVLGREDDGRLEAEEGTRAKGDLRSFPSYIGAD